MFILIFFLLFGVKTACADVYVVTAPDKSIFSLSEQDDAVVPQGYKKDIIKNKNIKDLTVTPGEENIYNFSGGKFTLNETKVVDKNKAEQAAIIAGKKERADRESGLKKLVDLGLTEDELKSLFR